MKKIMKKIFIVCLTILIISSVFSGCTNKGGSSTELSESKAEKQKENISEEPATLTYWCGLHGAVSATMAELGETPLYQELQKRTGVRIVFKHPPAGQEVEQFNLMIASNELADIIEYNWLRFPGGPEKAITDNIIAKLNDVIDQHAPNLKEYLSKNQEMDRMIKTDNGSYYVFPFLRGDKWLQTYSGPMLRKDWLDELGLEVPTTIAEWEIVLKAFKDKKGATDPLSFTPYWFKYSNSFAGTYGVIRGYYQENGKVKYGLVEQGYKEFLVLMNKWYKQGLLDPDFAVQDGKAFDAKITGGKTGATVAAAVSGVGRYTTLMKEKEPNFQLIAAPYPVLKEGDKPRMGQYDMPYIGGGSVAITTQCKNLPEAAKFLDYGYGKEGHMLFNFGIEGTSYTMENNYPKYTDVILKNPDNLPVMNAMGKYMRSGYSGPFVQDKREYEQVLQLEEQKDAITIWSDTENSAWLPPITPTVEESQELANIQNEINTYVDEMLLKFIMGQESLDNYDDYVAQVKKMGLDQALAIQQAALERYNNR